MPYAGRYTDGWTKINTQMKKIMFNDKYGLTKAVLEGRKTMTRRLVTGVQLGYIKKGMPGMAVVASRYKVGEVVAVAQSYGSILDALENPRNFVCMEHWESKSSDRAKYAEMAIYSPGGTNKMFVLAEEMPHQIRITNVRVERLQDISDEDCLREGVVACNCKTYFNGYAYDWCYDQDRDILAARWYKTPKKAFAALIDKVSGKGTWASNPWVFVYEFELVK